MRLLATMALGVLAAAWTTAGTAATWTEGKHYFRIQPVQATIVAPGKVEVAEVLSYGCPACAQFVPIMDELERALPAQAQLVYVHASFNAAEQWPMFQRAFYTSQQLGLVKKTHSAMFNAVWGRGELAVVDASGRPKKPAPTLEDVAKWYAKTAGIDAGKFLEASKSFSVDSNIRRAEAWMRACKIDQTPTMVINGKYRLTVQSAGGVKEMMELIPWLVMQETAATAASR